MPTNSSFDNSLRANPELSTTDSLNFLSRNASSLEITPTHAQSSSASSSLDTLEQALQLAEQYLKAFATSSNFAASMETAFGKHYNAQQAIAIATQWVNQDFSQLPQISVRSGADLASANGAFSAETNTIYLSSQYLNQNVHNVAVITGVILEETGHFLDVRINAIDSAGDEGDIFSRQVRGIAISANELLKLQAEDDHATIAIDGKTLAIEMSKSDFDGDGKSDVLWRNASTKEVAAWSMNGLSIKAGAIVQSQIGAEWQIAGIADFDGDGKSDVLWRNASTKEVAAWLMNGLSIKAGAIVQSQIGAEWQIAGIADFDGDGKSDVLWRNTSTKEVAAWLMNGLSIKAGAIVQSQIGAEWQIAGIADFDGDGKSDVLWRNASTKEVAAWLMNGLSIKAGAIVQSQIGAEWQIAGIADFDGDGKSDVLWRNASTKEVAAWLMNGLSIKAGAIVQSQIGAEWQIAGIADFDGDGKSDVLWRNASTKEVAAWSMNGLSIKTGATVQNQIGADWKIAGIADFDGDGKSDILWRNEVTKEVNAWLMNGLTIKAGATVQSQIGAEWQIGGTTLETDLTPSSGLIATSGSGNILSLSRDEQRARLGVNTSSTAYQSSGNKFARSNGTGGTYLWCTDYAYGRAIEKGLFQNDIGVGNKISGNAGQWDDNTQQFNRSARKNSIIVWDPNEGGAFSVGHVAFVEEVYADGSFLISESNWDSSAMAFNVRHIKPGSSAFNTAKFIYL